MNKSSEIFNACAITGATGGIGQAIAARLAKSSHRLLLLGRNEAELNALANRLMTQNPACQTHVLAGDLLQIDCLQAIAAKCETLEVDVFINNAGINSFGAAHKLSPFDQALLVQTNLLAPIHLTAALLPGFTKRPCTQIVQMGSIFGYIGYPGYAVYCASKFGLRGYAQALAREVADTGLRVKYFAPRATATALNSPAQDQLNRALKVTTDTPQHVAEELIKFLRSDRFEMKLGFPEKLYVFLNQLCPSINDAAIRKQLQTIQNHF